MTEVRLNLEYASERMLGRMAGLCCHGFFVSVGRDPTNRLVKYSPIVELIRAFTEPDFCDIVDHSVS